MKAKFWSKLILSMLFALSVAMVRGQIGIIPLAVSPLFLKTQLWNVSVSNTGAATQGRVQMDMKDMQTHQSVLSGVSAPFRISTGASMVALQAMEPITYSYNSPVVVDRTPNGPLPVGQYQVCYQLLLSVGETQGPVAEDCEEIAVEPLSPPLLTMPDDDSTVSVPQPNFTWMPPTPLNMFSDLTYDILISEVYDGQSLTDAIQKNLPIQQAQGLQQPFLTYPLQGPQLEDGKTYAWQVIARDHSQYAAKSDVWSFRTPTNKVVIGNNNSMYILMDGHTSGIGTSDSGVLCVKYVSQAAAYQASIQLTDPKGDVLMTTQCQIRQGDNYLNIPLNGNFERKHNYTAVFRDRGGKQTSVTFTIK